MHKTHEFEYGFTLVELMAVIAIIGILTSVTIVGVTGARDKARDKSAIAAMQAFLVEATLYRGKHDGSYDGVCTDTTLTEAGDYLAKVMQETGNEVLCANSESSFGALVELKDATYYCVDSTRYMGIIDSAALTSGLCS